MARLLIPTRNRPASLTRVLRYLELFYPGTKLIVADGSSHEYAEANAAVARACGVDLEVDYRYFGPDLPLFQRLIQVLAGEADEYFIMGADDDFPFLDGLAIAETKLDARPQSGTAMGATVNLNLAADDLLEAWINIPRAIGADTAEVRVRRYSAWPFSTTYAVTRRQLLLDRFRAAERLYSVNWGSFDYWAGINDVIHGEITLVPEVLFVATRNNNHSYWRADKLGFLRHGDRVLALRESISEDLVERGGMTVVEAEALGTRLITRRIAALVGHPPHKADGFFESALYQSGPVQRQIAAFHALFDATSEVRKHKAAQLAFIAESLKLNARSDDNRGEAATYEQESLHSASPSADEVEAPRRTSFARSEVLRRTSERGPKAALPRKAIDPSTMLPLGDTAAALAGLPRLHILVLGQSNVANHGGTVRSSALGAVATDDGWGPLADPIPGGSGDLGSVWTRFVPRLAQAGHSGDVTVTLLASGGSSMADWSAGGDRFAALQKALPGMAAGAFPPTHVVMHQGERDNLLGTKPSDYVRQFEDLYQSVRTALPQSQWLLCGATWRMGRISDGIKGAQRQILRQNPDIQPGPDTDILRDHFRRDGTHFNDDGLDMFAALLVESFVAATLTRPRVTSNPGDQR